jgi:hypothetical protein
MTGVEKIRPSSMFSMHFQFPNVTAGAFFKIQKRLSIGSFCRFVSFFFVSVKPRQQIIENE